jgi:hypothetical protein
MYLTSRLEGNWVTVFVTVCPALGSYLVLICLFQAKTFSMCLERVLTSGHLYNELGK